MSWNTPSARTTGTLITAAIWNSDVVDNPIALRGGALSIASQAAFDLLYASSASQLARLANGTTGQRLHPTTGAAPAWATADRVRAYHSTTQSLGSGVTAALLLDSEREDTAALHDTGSNTSRLSLTAGTWLLVARPGQVLGMVGGNDAMDFWIQQDGTTDIGIGQSQSGAAGSSHAFVGLLTLAVAAYVELMAKNISGATTLTVGHAATDRLRTSFEAFCLVKG